jgi:serine/threonine protein phosphatase 1
MSKRITFAIGDIHGCFEELRSLLDVCRESAGGVEHNFLCLGDYVDRGPASHKVIAYLMREQASVPSRFHCLLGNHDHMLCLAADQRRSDADLIQWWANGGEETLDAYGIDDPSDIPSDHLAWLKALPLYIYDDNRFFVHAGVRPGVSLVAQSKDDMLWICEPFLSSDLWHGALVVHGHTPTATRAPDVQSNRVNIDTGACFGGPLTAAAFTSDQLSPKFFVNSDGLNFQLRQEGMRPAPRPSD